MSGSCSSIAFSRRLALNERNATGRNPPAEQRQDAHDGRCRGDRGHEGEQEAAADADVEELDRPEREVGPLDLAVELLPEAHVRQRLLGRGEHSRRGGEALARAHACAALARLERVRLDAAAKPRSARRRHDQPDGDDRHAPHQEREQHRPEVVLVDEAGDQLRACARLDERRRRVARHLHLGLVRAEAREGRLQVDRVSRARCGEVRDAPRAPELLGDRAVRIGDGRARARGEVRRRPLRRPSPSGPRARSPRPRSRSRRRMRRRALPARPPARSVVRLETSSPSVSTMSTRPAFGSSASAREPSETAS